MLPVGDLGEAVAIADRVRRNFAVAATLHDDDTLRPTVSVGVTLGTEPRGEVTGLLAGADRALYRAKANGRNRVEASETPDVPQSGPEQQMEPAVGFGERRRWRRAVGA